MWSFICEQLHWSLYIRVNNRLGVGSKKVRSILLGLGSQLQVATALGSQHSHRFACIRLEHEHRVRERAGVIPGAEERAHLERVLRFVLYIRTRFDVHVYNGHAS